MLFPLFDLNPHRRFPFITLLIIAINIAVTVWTETRSQVEHNRIALQYGFMPARLSNMGSGRAIPPRIMAVKARNGRQVAVPMGDLSTAPSAVYPTFLTAMFLHGGWAHLLMNMWMLWVFGNNIEDRLGPLVYVLFYVLGGVLATLVFWASDPEGVMPMIGASGAVAAVLGGYAVTFPQAKVRTLIFFILITIVDIPALVLLGIWFALQVVSGLMGLWGHPLEPVAFWAHIGGFISGMILVPLFTLGAAPPGKDWRKETDALFSFEDPRFQ